MQNSSQTSFMPQQPLIRTEGGMRRREPLNLALVLALIAFFVTLVVAGGVFFLNKQAVARVTAASQQLEDAEKLLNIEEIANFKQIHTRILTARGLLNNHTVFSVILNFLEESTTQKVSLTSLGYGKEAGKLVLTIAGQAPSYEAVYFQGETWKITKPVTSMKLSSVSLEESTGIVSFIATINLDESSTRYATLYQKENSIRNQLPATSNIIVVPQTP